MTRTHGSLEREPHGARRAEEQSSRVVAEIRLKSEFAEQGNVELSAAKGLAVPSFSRQDASASRTGTKVGSDESFGAVYRVRPLVLALLTAFLR
jgi:hypothetical protein